MTMHEEEGYWESDYFPVNELTLDKVISCIFESGAPGDSFFFTNTNKEEKPWQTQIVIVWGEGWFFASGDDDDEAYVVGLDPEDDDGRD